MKYLSLKDISLDCDYEFILKNGSKINARVLDMRNGAIIVGEGELTIKGTVRNISSGYRFNLMDIQSVALSANYPIVTFEQLIVFNVYSFLLSELYTIKGTVLKLEGNKITLINVTISNGDKTEHDSSTWTFNIDEAKEIRLVKDKNTNSDEEEIF